MGRGVILGYLACTLSGLWGCQSLGIDRVAYLCETDDQCGDGWTCGPCGRCVSPVAPWCAADGEEGDATGVDGIEADSAADVEEGDATGVDGSIGADSAAPAVDACTPSCLAKLCGDDGCGGSCGTCPGGFTCTALGTCESGTLGEVYVPPGAFWMGCNGALDGDCDDDELPQHEVHVPGFYIDRTEVTAGAYAACVESGSCAAPEYDSRDGGSYTYADPVKQQHPMNGVTWEQAEGYCMALGKRLCTEAEWEKAARGGCETVSGDCKGGARTYPWGEDEPTCGLCWFSGCGGDPRPVGLLAAGASPYGALDMAGNAWEWVRDCYHGTYDAAPGAPADGSAWEEGAEPDDCSGSRRVIRGGSLGVAASVRASNRDHHEPASAYFYLGFRCCRAVE